MYMIRQHDAAEFSKRMVPPLHVNIFSREFDIFGERIVALQSQRAFGVERRSAGMSDAAVQA
jgi:hypothetical protein